MRCHQAAHELESAEEQLRTSIELAIADGLRRSAKRHNPAISCTGRALQGDETAISTPCRGDCATPAVTAHCPLEPEAAVSARVRTLAVFVT
jgi:hypothetical protein